VTAQAYEKAKVKKLETLTKILMFRQDNMFTPDSLVFMMLAVKKEPVNWVAWFYQKLQNELVVVQRKIRKSINILVGPTLTIIGYYYRELFVRE
jgi:hypothetical protein